MKKVLMTLAVAAFTVSASAQTVVESKTFDNIYVGINGGVATKMTHHRWLKNLNPNAGLRIGRWFTPVFGLAVESQAYFNHRPYKNLNTFVDGLNTSVLATVNVLNWFCGYPGEPRSFEVIPVYGFGWGHTFGSKSERAARTAKGLKKNDLTSKAGIDFAYNFGGSKEWQVYVEPSVIWTLNGRGGDIQYDINRAYFQANVGLNYKFGTSNGTHNFKIAEVRDQAEIDALNARINQLQDELAQKPKEVIKEVVKEAPTEVREVKVEDLVFVTFAQGKSALTADAKKALNNIESGKHVQIVGTASPEGSKEINDRLSQARADVVADYLKGRGVVIDEATGKGVQGTTSNRLAVVYVK